jgi:5'(3')-deoxyribonucleotidase
MLKELNVDIKSVFLRALTDANGQEIVFVDMDGVVADFDKTATIWAERMGITPQEFKDNKHYRQPKFYAELELIPGAKEAVMELGRFYDVRFLSAPSWGNPDSFTEKRIWIEKHFGEFAHKKMDLTFRKDLAMGHYLIDDRTKYGAGKFIGKHIQFGIDPFHTWDDVIKFFKYERGIID